VRGSSVGDPPCARLEALEVRLDILCRGSGARELAESVGAAWDWCTVEPLADEVTEAVQRVVVLLDDDPEEVAGAVETPLLLGRDLPTLMDRLSPMVTRLAVNERRRDLVMFHACAVADPETGDAIVLYGPSGTGKTTLARTLCTDLVYPSDETAGVTPDLRVVPYPKPLSIIVDHGDTVKEQVSPTRLRLVRPGRLDYRLRALVQLRRDPEHRGDAVLETLATVDALPELVAQTSYTREMERPLHRLADLARDVGGVRRATYAEAAQLRPVARAILDGEL
jgi:hypothetical protein